MTNIYLVNPYILVLSKVKIPFSQGGAKSIWLTDYTAEKDHGKDIRERKILHTDFLKFIILLFKLYLMEN